MGRKIQQGLKRIKRCEPRAEFEQMMQYSLVHNAPFIPACAQMELTFI
jgi:hypothetical protein